MAPRYQFLSQAKRDFGFLTEQGFQITSEREGTYYSFKDGFELRYLSGKGAVDIEYWDSEFVVYFTYQGLRAHYYFLDRELYGSRSGCHGAMFLFDKLSPVISEIAADIRQNYGDILRGEPAIWSKIEKLLKAPREPAPKLP